jgi:Raf kinase inhibitor-like YbhB/YbcL family protein
MMTPAPKLCAAGITFLTLAATITSAAAQAPETTRSAPFTPRAIYLAPPKPGASPIMVSSPDFANQNYQDKRFFQTVVGGLNMAPGVFWSAGPAGTQSYVLFMEGEGGGRIDPTVHWIVYNIPASATRLPTGIAKDAYIKEPAGAINGREDSSVFHGTVGGEPGYRGPNFSADGGRPHPYSFEVFALDTKLDLDPAQAGRDAVINAMQGHVLASGVVAIRFGADNFKPPQ